MSSTVSTLLDAAGVVSGKGVRWGETSERSTQSCPQGIHPNPCHHCRSTAPLLFDPQDHPAQKMRGGPCGPPLIRYAGPAGCPDPTSSCYFKTTTVLRITALEIVNTGGEDFVPRVSVTVNTPLRSEFSPVRCPAVAMLLNNASALP